MDSDPVFTLRINISLIVISIIGIVGNVISFIVFSRKTFRNNSINIYCRALAIFDMFIIYIVIINVYYISAGSFIIYYSDAVCAAFSYAYRSFGSIPGWILIAFSCDKVLTMRKLSAGMKRPIIHYSIIVLIVLFNLLLYIEIPIQLKLVTVKQNGVVMRYICDVSTLSYGNVLNIIYIIESSILPFLIMFGSSLMTIKLLRDSRKHVNLTGVVAEKRKSRDNKYAVTSFTFNVLFIVLRMPLVICTVLGLGNVSYYLSQTSSLLFFLNYSISFFIHCASNSLFRRELFVLMKVRKPVSNAECTENARNKMKQANNTITIVKI